MSADRRTRAAKLAGHKAAGTYVQNDRKSHFTRPDIERAFIAASRGTAELNSIDLTGLQAKHDLKKHRSAKVFGFAPRRPFRPGRLVRGVMSHERALRTLGYAINGRLLARQKRTPQRPG